MRRLPLQKVQPGATLGASIKIPSPHPEVLYKLKFEPGRTLTTDDIEKLKNSNIQSVTIKDPATNDLDEFMYDKRVEKAQDEVLNEFNNLSNKFEQKSVSGSDITKLKSAIENLIKSLKNTHLMTAFTSLKTHDSYTAQHSLDVAKISLQVAIKFEIEFSKQLREESGADSRYINQNMLTDLGLGGMLHDIGKKEIPNQILSKPSKLTNDEWEQMKAHSEIGYNHLKELKFELNAPSKVPAYQHHEKFDGTGYPRGLEGTDIHLFGRLSALADVYSALTSKRPYRNAKSPATALSIMESMQADGPHFDPDLFDKFKSLILPFPVGQNVVLSDGSEGVVCGVDSDSPRKPNVRILYRNGERLSDPEELKVPNTSNELKIVEPSSHEPELVSP